MPEEGSTRVGCGEVGCGVWGVGCGVWGVGRINETAFCRPPSADRLLTPVSCLLSPVSCLLTTDLA
ncbi:MAG: hypothetical protein EWV82_09900 [Microcystis aeruginosa Ma_AC_P_19900807_S299]|nr:MAG: hypothetical protein EWV82_09900 [Microcystis aeruginosa Ma_AC_P_19900807_S299]